MWPCDNSELIFQSLYENFDTIDGRRTVIFVRGEKKLFEYIVHAAHRKMFCFIVAITFASE